MENDPMTSSASLKHRWYEVKPSVLFISKLVLTYIAWKVWIMFIGTEDMPIEERMWPWLSVQWEAFNDLVRSNLIYLSSCILEFTGISSTAGQYHLGIEGTSGMSVGNYCLALQLWFFFTGVVIALPSTWKFKVWFIPLGLLGIHILNTLRIVALGWLLVYAPQYFDINHYYILRGVVFILIFLAIIPYLKNFSSGNPSYKTE